MKDLKFKVRTVHDRGEDNMNINGYLDYINVPWGRLFYRLVWHNLGFIGEFPKVCVNLQIDVR